MAEDNNNQNNQNNEENSKEGISRRTFIKNTGLVTGGVVGGGLLGGVIGNQWFPGTDTATTDETESNGNDDPTRFQEARMFFKREEDFNVLSAATETIFPEDEHGPGAIALGVPYFIDRQLAGPWGKNSGFYIKAPFQDGESRLNKGDIFLQGVRKINEVGQDEHGDVFPDLEGEQQIEILKAFNDGEIDMTNVDSSQFFQLLRQGTLEGAYSDPMYGGNKNMEGWKMKEYPGAQTSLRHMMDEDEDLDEEFVVIEPLSLSEH